MTTLNTMFTENANTMFNNKAFNYRIIPAMHDQMKRLYEAARLLRQLEGQAAVAKLFNTSSQRLNNWEDRGISNEGLLQAQQLIGCDAIWLRDGTGEMVRSGAQGQVNASDIAALVQLFGECDADGRSAILNMATVTARLSSTSTKSVAHNKPKH